MATTDKNISPIWAFGTIFALAATVLQCEELDGGYCLPCSESCPGNLTCSKELKKCVDPNGPPSCDDSSGNSSVTGGIETSGNGGSAGAPGCSSETSCTPEVVGSRRLRVDCSDDRLAVPLTAKCSCDTEPRQAHWTLLGGPPGLTLDDGVLGGAPPPGLYSVQASVTIDDSPARAVDFELEVSECFTFFVQAGPNPGQTRVAAARNDSGNVTALSPKSEDAVFSGFDISPAGDLLGQVFTLDGHQELQVFRVDRGAISELELSYEGGHLAHAFSLDSRWLAVITTDPADPEGSLLRLIDLDRSGEVKDEMSITPSEALLWSKTGILRFGESRTLPEQRVLFEHVVEAGTLTSEVELRQASVAGSDPLYALLQTPAGVLTTFRTRLLFVGDERDDVRVQHGPVEAFSPGYGYIASGDTPGTRIDFLDLPLPANPRMRATECDFLRAWSPDDSTIFCTTSSSEGSRGLVYPISPEQGAPDATELPLPNGYEHPWLTATTRARVAISAQGTWIALVPNNEDGLFVIHAEDFDAPMLTAPSLGPPEQSYEWDFLFAHDGFTGAAREFVVQHGRELKVAALDNGDSSLDFGPEYDVELPPVPECELEWFPEMEKWCGAPQYSGNLMLSRTQRYVTFHDIANDVYSLDLRTLELERLGTLAAGCCPDCPDDRATNCILTQ